ncbi:hypothetical protein [Halorientalis sp.]|nr:hypothetical protein [Halorientalis sp.]
MDRQFWSESQREAIVSFVDETATGGFAVRCSDSRSVAAVLNPTSYASS